MENLLNIHGKCFGKFWACETCAEVGWSPQFNNKAEMEIHISKLHMSVKSNKINLDDRICSIVDTIKSCDDWFNSLIDIDFDDCHERVKFFIGSEDKIGYLNNNNFKNLIKQIENFYDESGSFDSVVKFNYNIDIIPDIVTRDFVGFITESEVYQGYNYDMLKIEEEKCEVYFEYTDKSCEVNKDVINIIEDENSLKNVDKHIKVDEIYQDNKLHDLKPNSIKNEEHENYEEECENIQCNICGEILEEDSSLQLHVEYKHKDYFLDEDNFLLLKETLKSKEYSITKCILCLENFKMNDLNKHVKSLHSTEFEENENYSENIVKTDKSETIPGNTINNDFCDPNLFKIDLEKDEQFQNEDYFCDVTLACEDKQLKTHKCILSTSTNYIDIREYEFDETSINEMNNDRKSSTFYKTNNYDKNDLKTEEGNNVDIFDENDSIEFDDSLLNLTIDYPFSMGMKYAYSLPGISIEQEIFAEDHSKHKYNEDSNIHENKQKSVIELKNTQNGVICDKSDSNFIKRYNLYQHRVSVHKQVQYSCDFCEYNSEQKEHFKIHRKVHVNFSEFYYYVEVGNKMLERKKDRRRGNKPKKDWKKRRKKISLKKS